MTSALSVRRRMASIAAAGMLAVTLAACAPPDPAISAAERTPSPVPPSSATGSAGLSHPAPGRTVEAVVPGHTGDVRGVRVAVVVPDDGATSRALQEALHGFAEVNGLVVEEFAATGDAASIDAAFTRALAVEPHIVVGLGAGVVDVFAYNSSQWLDQDFLLLGAQVAEPTSNVAAVVWEGATSRGSGAPADGELDHAAVTTARAADAVSVGLATVMSGESGIVLHLPA
ncbi:hypothetical protein HF576_10035 [Microbacterium sp. CFH 90308]|uniref:BMP family ABC transporter substrate-binding protein n=1 Tax=Microbacterium salsuginis TaxID=2722803 RepID=A0ABX1KAY9_9MICO|nr:hypothetical protein [Microbacterium sp. CFH 90308]NLP84191.1 hypothetical protein [Microbacterium sp. CFH 90308]